MNGKRRRREGVLVFAVALLFLMCDASRVSARLADFAPKIIYYEGDLEFDAAFQQTTNSFPDHDRKTSDTFFSQRISFSGEGFVYHPRFIYFFGTVGAGLSQENFSDNWTRSPDSGWRTAFLREYNVRAVLLPEHPYNLEVYAFRSNPILRLRDALNISNPVSSGEGAVLRYIKRQWNVRLKYSQTHIDSPVTSGEDTQMSAFASHHAESRSRYGIFTSLEALRRESNLMVDSLDEKSDSNEFTAANMLWMSDRRTALSSRFSELIFKQTSPTKELKTTRMSLTEQLSSALPWGFEVDATYVRSKDTLNNLELDTLLEQDDTTKQDLGSLSLTHRLYQSLTSYYSIHYGKTSGRTGAFSVFGQALGVNYIKRIPGGTLQASVSAGRDTSDLNGTTAVFDEAHQAKLLEDFMLQSSQIDEASVIVRVKSPISGNVEELRRDVHYTIFEMGGNIYVRVVSLPPAVMSPDLLFVYEFKVSYNLLIGDVKLETSTVGYSIRLDLLGNHVSPYYSWSNMSQRVISGVPAGIPDEGPTQIIGIVLQNWGARLQIQYTDAALKVNRYNSFNINALYGLDITPYSHLGFDAFYMKYERAGVDIPGFVRNHNTQTSIGANAVYQQFFLGRDLSLNSTAGYTHTNDNEGGTANSYYLASSAVWEIGKMSISMSANISRIDSELKAVKTEGFNQFYSLNIRRTLF